MRKSLIDRLFLPTVLSLTTVVFALIILQRMLTQQQHEVQASTNAQALLVKNKMESKLKARILPLELLSERWEASVLRLTLLYIWRSCSGCAQPEHSIRIL